MPEQIHFEAMLTGENIVAVTWVCVTVMSLGHLLLEKREPSATIAWLFFILLLPFGGAFIYLTLGSQRLERKAIKRKREIEKLATDPLSHGEADNLDLPPDVQRTLRLARQISEYSFTDGNQIELLADPHRALEAMKTAIEGAKNFIHLEYYIIQSDDVTKQLFDALEAATRRGVQVRLLYDALGSMWLKRIFLRRLTKVGAKVASFLPISILPQRLNFNFRNHRKILVIDGLVAFTGGTNIGREYLGRRNKKQWHDYTVKVTGPTCSQLEDVFAKDWHFTTQEDLFSAQYYPQTDASGESTIQVMESGPDSTFLAIHHALFHAMTSATKEILLTTPYFIPDPAIMTTLRVAALRGLRVRLVLPQKTDNWVVRYASRSFYDSLLRAGVEIYEFQPRILHAKLMQIDDRLTIVGSANMDTRSFRLNFELNLLVYGKTVADQAQALFEIDLSQSKRVDLEVFSQRPVHYRMLENACRLFSPLL